MKERLTNSTNLEIEEKNWEIQTLALPCHVLQAFHKYPTPRTNCEGFETFSSDVFPSLKEVIFLHPAPIEPFYDMRPEFSTINLPETDTELLGWEKWNTIIGCETTYCTAPIYELPPEPTFSVAIRRQGQRLGEVDNTAGR